MKKISLIIVLLVLALCANTSHTNISDMSISQGVSIDNKDDKIEISCEYLDLSKGTGTTDTLSENITSVVTSSGDNISNAISTCSSKLSSPIFFGQNKVVVLGSNYAESGISDYIDYIVRTVDTRPDVLIAFSKSNANEIFDAKDDNSKVPAQKIYEMLKNSEKMGICPKVNANDLVNLSSSKQTDIFLPSITKSDNEVYCDGVAIFSDNAYVKTLDDSQSLGFSLIKGNVSGASVTLSDEKFGNVSIEIVKEKPKLSAVYKDNILIFNVDVKLILSLNNIENGITVKLDESDIESLENLVSETIKSYCESAINTCFSNNSDPFMFSNIVAKSYPSLYESKKENWRNYLENVLCNVNINSDLSTISDNLLS